MAEVDGAWLEQFTTLGWRHSEALRTLRAQGRQGSRDTAPEILASLKKNEFRLSKTEVSETGRSILLAARVTVSLT